MNAGQHLNNYFYLTPEKTSLPEKKEESCVPKSHVVICDRMFNKKYYNDTIEKQLTNSQITALHFEWVIRHLQKEIKRANERQSRRENSKLSGRVNNTISTMEELQELYSNKKIDYSNLNTKLATLELKMHHTNFIKYRFCQFFSHKHRTKAAVLIKKMRHDITPKIIMKTC